MNIELNEEEAKMFKSILINQVRKGEYDENNHALIMIHKMINQLSKTNINNQEFLEEKVQPIIGILSNWNNSHYIHWYVKDNKSSKCKLYNSDEKDIKKCFKHGNLSIYYSYIDAVDIDDDGSNYLIGFSTKYVTITIRISKSHDSYYMVKDIQDLLTD